MPLREATDSGTRYSSDVLLAAWDWTSFNTGTAAGLIATILALAAGIPIGLSLNRVVERRQQRGDREKLRGRKLAILRSLKSEIEHNLSLIEQMSTEFKAGDVPLYPLDLDLWSALSGEAMGAVSSSSLIADLPRLYFEFRHLQRKLDVQFQLGLDPSVVRYAGSNKNVGEHVRNKIVSAIEDQRPVIEEISSRVLDGITDELATLAE